MMVVWLVGLCDVECVFWVFVVVGWVFCLFLGVWLFWMWDVFEEIELRVSCSKIWRVELWGVCYFRFVFVGVVFWCGWIGDLLLFFCKVDFVFFVRKVRYVY